MRKKLFIGAGALVALLVLATGVISWKASSSLLYPDDDAFPEKPAGMQIEDVEFKTSDNITISGWYVPPKSCQSAADCTAAPGVVLSHGRGSNRGAFIDELPVLHEAGFALLDFDYRGQGHSQQVIETAGAHEQLDLDAAVDFLRNKNGVKPGTVSLIGKSLGGSIALLTAADNPNIGAVVDESGFAKLSDVVSYNFTDETGLPAFPFAPLAIKIAEQRADVNLADVAPVKTVDQISPRPLLVVHAKDDKRVHYDQSEKNFAAAGEPKTFWRLDGNEHADSISLGVDAYKENVVKFLLDNTK